MDEQDFQEWGGPKAIRKEFVSTTMTTPTTTTTPTFPPQSTTRTTNPTTTTTTTTINSSITTKDMGWTTTRTNTTNTTTQDQLSLLHDLFHVTHQSIGPKLLRYLGWREGGSTAFVRRDKDDHDDDDDDEEHDHNNNQNHDHDHDTVKNNAEEKIVLSHRRLRKIQLQQTRIRIPPPKLDQCGLGFEPYRDAPEFKRHKERRNLLAQERVTGRGRPVYRTSNLISQQPTGTTTRYGTQLEDAAHATNPYMSFETIEDFVGTKSVGGFALRDDDDQAYDEDDNGDNDDAGGDGPRSAMFSRSTQSNGKHAGTKRLISSDEYNTEVYEHVLSDDEDGNHKSLSHGTGFDLGGALASWAKTTPNTVATNNSAPSKPSAAGLTADGRPPLPGFILGGSIQTHVQRFPGPDVPIEYRMQRHAFGANEHPLIFQTLSRAVQLQKEDDRRESAFQEALEFRRQQRDQKQITSMAGGRFSALQQAMKNRFTTGGGTDNISSTITTINNNDTDNGQSNVSSTSIGLHLPLQFGSSTQNADTLASSSGEPQSDKPKEIKITRKVQFFAPHPLVCKRFHVPVPKHSSATAAAAAAAAARDERKTEASYFHNEIMAGITTPGIAPTSLELETRNANKKPSKSSALTVFEQLQQQDDSEKTSTTGIPRPPMDTFKSIFDPLSESSDESDEEDQEERATDHLAPEAHRASPFKDENATTKTASNMDHVEDEKPITESQLVVYHGGVEEKDANQERHREARRAIKKKHSRSVQSGDPDGDSDHDDTEYNDGQSHGKRRKKKRSWSESSDSLDHDGDSGDSRNKRRKKDRRRDRKHKKKKKRSKSSKRDRR